MRLRHLGYVGQNLTLGLTTGRTLRLANLTNEERLAEVIASNLADLETILRWNVAHDIRCFRISSSLIPFASHPHFRLDWRQRFAAPLERIAAYAAEHALRLSMHPGQYTVLNAVKPHVLENALTELEYHAHVLDAVAGEAGTITLHVGGAVPKAHVSTARAPGEKAHADHVDDSDLDLALAVLAEAGGDQPIDLMLEAKAKEAAVLRQQARLATL